MKIINADINQGLWEIGKAPIIGFVSGPVRALGGALQVVANAVLALFLSIPSFCGLIKKDSNWHVSKLIRDLSVGGLHILRGIYETLPLTSFIIKCSENSSGSSTCPVDDHPFFHAMRA